ncbi:hypothetical protein BH20ACT12_BH20ACT12_18030 [soil metagenome]
MNSQHARPGLAGNVSVTPAGRLRGRRLFLARTGCALAAVLLVGLFAVAVPARYEQMIVLSDLPSGIDPDVLRANLKDSGISTGLYAAHHVATEAGFAAVCVALAAAIFWRRSDERMALLVALTLVLLGTTFWNTTTALALYDPVLYQVGQSLGIIGKTSLFLFFYLFPDGRFVPRWTRFVAIGLVLGVTSEIAFPESPFAVSNWPVPLFLLFMFGWLLTGVFAQIYRYRRVSNAVQRQQTKWVMLGFVAALGGFLGTVFFGEVLFSLARPGTPGELFGTTLITLFMLLIPISIAVAILRYRLFDIDFLINRTLVYGALTVCVVGVYVFVVGYLGELFRSEDNLLVSLAATGIVAVLFAPLRDRLQRLVDRLMYGERDDPYAVLSRLGQRLEATLVPEAMLPTVVDTVAETLKLPYAAIEIERNDTFEVAASVGGPVTAPVHLPLYYGGTLVGRLILGTRAGEEAFASADRRLLDDLARQAGVAVHAARLTDRAIRLSADLQRSRERLVAAREEERRRLRRDLHDGLGPQLASLTMKAEAARDLIPVDPDRAESLLGDLTEQAQDAVADVRSLVYALRPPALDTLGLVGAVRSQVSQYTSGNPRVEIEAPEGDCLPPLTAAVEVAAYRIILEALNNAARHADARNCKVRLSLDEEPELLTLEVSDDGRGIGEDRKPGVGLSSIRERA